MPKPYIFALTLLLSIILSSAFAESITLSTYYPAPYGIYSSLRLPLTPIWLQTVVLSASGR